MRTDKCIDCSNNITTDTGDVCNAMQLQGLMEPEEQPKETKKSIPSTVCRAMKSLCSAEGRWFVHK